MNLLPLKLFSLKRRNFVVHQVSHPTFRISQKKFVFGLLFFDLSFAIVTTFSSMIRIFGVHVAPSNCSVASSKR